MSYTLIVSVGTASFAQVSTLQIRDRSPAGTNFLLYVPASYAPGTPLPLLISLHGMTGIGDDLNLIINDPPNRDESPAWLIHRNLWPASRPFIVLSPQLPRDESIIDPAEQEWPPSLINEVIEYVSLNYTIDINRIYLTGLSLGAAGVWSYAQEYPNVPAALLPISGATDTTRSCFVADVPIWAFHGSVDRVVSPANSIVMVGNINECISRRFKSKLNLLHAWEHERQTWSNVWNYSNGYKVFDWLLQHNKNDNNNRKPYVNAGFDRRMLKRNESISLYGEYFDFDGNIESVEWRKLIGPNVILNNVDSQFVSLTQFQSGRYSFELRVVDDDGAVNSDTVQLEIIDLPSSNEAIVNNIILVNGDDNVDIGNLYEGQVLNKHLQLNSRSEQIITYNLRVAANTNTRSIRYRINTDANIRNGTSLYLRPVGLNEWPVPLGEYNICATAYRQTGALQRDEGLTECYRFSVFDQPIRTYYSKLNTDLSNLNSWSESTDGSGSPPVSLRGNFQILNVINSASINNPLNVEGVQSFFWVRDGGELTINSSFNGLINVEGNGTVIVNTNQPVEFGQLSANSTVIFDQNATDIPIAQYGNVILRGSSLIKKMNSGDINIAGDLTISENTLLNGNESLNSFVSIGGNIFIQGTNNFTPTNPFHVIFQDEQTHRIETNRTMLHFASLSVSAGAVVEVIGKTVLQLGSQMGGGLEISTGSQLLINQSDLHIINNGAINRLDQQGSISFKHSNLLFNSNSDFNSNLYLINSSDSIENFSINNIGSGSVIVKSSLFIENDLSISNGTLRTNGFVHLVSTGTKSAFISEIKGNGRIEGELNIQRNIPKGRQYRYLSFPTDNFTVDNLQQFIPVSGTFAGRSIGNGISTNPSLFYYDEPAGGWIPFPVTDSAQRFQLGKGYSVFVRNDSNDTKLLITGNIHQGDFTFDLVPDPSPNSANADDGWNLIGNPYPANIRWRHGNWVSNGVSPTVYIRDNSYPGGRFLFWDGEIGNDEGIFNGLISQGQSMWVRAVSATPSLRITESSKESTQSNLFRVKDTENSDIISLQLSDGNLIDKAFFKVRKNGSNLFMDYADAVKKDNGYFNISILTNDQVKAAIKVIPDSFCGQWIPLKIELNKPGLYSIKFDGSFFNTPKHLIELRDSLKLESFYLSSNQQFYIDVKEQDIKSVINRFKVRLFNKIDKPVINADGVKLFINSNLDIQWYLNGEIIKEENENEIYPTISGDYYVIVRENGCSVTSEPYSFIVSERLVLPTMSVNIFPNPTNGIIEVNGLPPLESEFLFQISDWSGRIIKKGSLNQYLTNNFIVLDESIPSGIYYLNIISKEKTFRRRIVLNR